MRAILFNIILFKIGWVAVVFGATHQLAWLGSIVVAFIVLIHLKIAVTPILELILISIAALVGFLWESLLVNQHVLVYVDHPAKSIFAPYWIVVMWILFATTFNISMRWLRQNSILAVGFGAIGSVLSFIAGEYIGAVSFPNTALALSIICLGWAALVPIMIQASIRFDGYRSNHVLQEELAS